MGHTIYTWTIDDTENARRNAIADANEIASRESYSGNGLNGSIRWIDIVCKCERDAEQFIHDNDKGFYDSLAVKFKEPKNSKSLNNAIKKLNDERNKKFEYNRDNTRKNTSTAKFVTCPECGSKLNRELLKSNNCPMCRTDLRSETIKNRLSKFDTKIKELERKVLDETRKASEHGKVKWLVKIEFNDD